MPNETVIAAIGSLTMAMKARGILLSSGMAGEVIALPPEATKRGCAWGVEFDMDKESLARRAFRSAHISVSQYLRRDALP